mmetsp:Transcript_10099/g.26784  ORF Transcript_10099/g.26784 Transcript_10099/m.26784 type:complete len:582 (+) Transcript_10099:181-1926(+)
MPPRQDSSSDSSDSDKDQKPKLPSRDRDFTSQRAGAIESDSSDDEAAPLRTQESSDDEAPQRRKVPPLKHKTTIGQRMRGVIGSVFAKRTKSQEPSQKLMETWKSQGRDANTPRGQDVGDDSDASVDSDGVKRKRFKIDPADMKGGTMQIKDMKTLLQYLEPDPDYGTQPVERHLMPIDDWLHRPETCEDIPTYIEDPKTGRWRKLRKRHAVKKKEEHSREERKAVAALDAELDAVDRLLKNEAVPEDRAMKLERVLNAFFTAARGAFCGLAGGVIIINFALSKDRQLLDHYGRTSNLFRRWGYLLATTVFVGALNAWHNAQANARIERIDPILTLEVRSMVVIYFFALVFTLAMATADVSLSKHWKDWDPDTLNAIELQLYNDRDDDWENMFYGKATELQTFKTWRFCCWARFVCAALGWLVSLNRFDQLSKQLHAKRREIDALRGAVRTASTKMIDLYNEQEKNKEVPTGTEALRDLLGRRGLPVPAEAQDLVRNPLLEAEAPVVKDEKPSALQKMAALQKKKADLKKSSEESKTTENPIRNVRVVQAKPASPAKSDASGSSDDSSTDDEGPRDLLTGR